MRIAPAPVNDRAQTSAGARAAVGRTLTCAAARFSRPLVAAVCLACVPPAAVQAAEPAAPAPVVINEIMYHPPEGRDELQYVELLNAGTNVANLAGWSLRKGVEFAFPHGTELPPGGYVVVGRDLAALRKHYGAQLKVAGVFTGKLSHQGKRIELTDARGHMVDTVEYHDHAPWPLGPDGYGASLERICPSAPADDPANWASSEFKPGGAAVGTPGSRNTGFSALPLPRVADVHAGPVEPDRAIAVTATVADDAGVQSVALAWWVASETQTTDWAEAPMKLQSGDTRRGVYTASIPAEPEGRLIRFLVKVKNAAGAERRCPAKTEPRPTFSCATFVNTNTARVPFVRLLSLQAVQRQAGSRRLQPLLREAAPHLTGMPPSWDSALVYFLPDQKEPLVFDHVHVRTRKYGLKVHFLKDQTLEGMTGIDLLCKGPPRYLLSEPLAQELYRRAGVPALTMQQVRLWFDARPLGSYLLMEQPNQAFLRRHGRNAAGNLYKLLWYERGLVGQHEKKTNLSGGHDDLVQLVNGLNHTTGDAQWDFIQQNFNVDEMIDYYAVSMCIEDWDGYFNNYYAYHDLRPGGKWEVFPWDKDKTWGDYDSASRQYDWYEMPLTYGMNGAKAPGAAWFWGWPVGGAEWWRPPGYFSGPLLANPEFRRRFLSRLREICETIFTPEIMGPVIRAMETQLEDEVRVRAALTRQSPEVAVREFHAHIQSFQNQVVNRRKFILTQLNAGARQP